MSLNLNLVKDFDDNEKELIKLAHAENTGLINQSKVVSDIYVARMARESTQMLIDANRDMSKASERWAKALTVATWALVFVTLILVVVTLFHQGG